MKSPLSLFVSACVSIAALSCGTIPSKTDEGGSGAIDVRVWINRPPTLAKAQKARETTWDRLVVQVSAADMGTATDTFDIDMERSLNSVLLEEIPSGENRMVKAWTIDDVGDTIHGGDSATINIQPAQTVVVTLELNPVKGSIYIELSDFPANVDSVLVVFESGAGTWSSKDKKTTKFFIALDKIPFGTEGVLSIAGLDVGGDTVAFWKKTEFVFENTNSTIEASFISVGEIDVEVSVSYPGVTLVRGIMDTTDSLDDEQTSLDSLLIISEIMFTAGSGTDVSFDYIEIYNPSPSDIIFDTLILDVSGSKRYLTGVTIEKDSFFVVGNSAIPVEWGVDTLMSLDLVSTTNIISLYRKDMKIIDRVFCENSDNVMGWPNLSSSAKIAVVLDSPAADPEYNNYGRNWVPAVTQVHSSTPDYLGTPGRAGN